MSGTVSTTDRHATASASKLGAGALAVGALLLLPLILWGGGRPESLQLRAVIANPDVCLHDKTLELELVVMNEGDSPIGIYKSAIHEFSFTKEVVSGKNRWKWQPRTEMNDVGTGDPARREAPLVLNPHSSVVFPVKHEISDAYFAELGLYSVQVRYTKLLTKATAEGAFVGSLESNEVLFRRSPCE